MSEPKPPSREGAQENGPAPVLRGSSLIITNTTQLIGLAVFINEAVIRPEGRPLVMVLCGAFVLGIQVVENAVLRLIDRVFGTSSS